MSVTKQFLVLALFLCAAACTDVSPPNEEKLVDHLRSIDHPDLTNQAKRLLDDMVIVNLAHESDDPVALLTVRPIDAEDASQDVSLVVVSTDNGWELYDSDMKDRNSSTSMLLLGH